MTQGAGPVRVWVDEGSTVEAGTLFPHRRGRSQSATLADASGYLARAEAHSLDPALLGRHGLGEGRPATVASSYGLSSSQLDAVVPAFCALGDVATL